MAAHDMLGKDEFDAVTLLEEQFALQGAARGACDGGKQVSTLFLARVPLFVHHRRDIQGQVDGRLAGFCKGVEIGKQVLEPQ